MTESHWMILVGFLFFPLTFLVYKKLEFFMRGRISGFWLEILAEKKTIMLIQYFSVPLVVLIGIGLIVGEYLRM